ncbi:MAG: HD-GYP domain-containing protein [Firmicutes bacterium]|nr:HD-GYP domain-containing protein [Bacillota bacterium]
MRKVPVWALKPGMKVARPIYDSRGALLLNSGVEIKKEYVHNLQIIGVPAVYIVDNIIPDVEIEDIILDDTRQKAKRLINDIAREARRQPGKKSVPRLILENKGIKNVLKEIIDQLLTNQNLIVNLADIRTADSYTFAHSVNVAVMAILTGISLQVPRSRLPCIGIGALMHDLGKIRISTNILNKRGKLTHAEFEEIKKHPRIGYEMFKTQRGCMDVASALMIYQHHERMNGSGYPEKLKGEEIHIFARVCAVVDVYDALVADRPYRAALQPHVAFQILESSGEEFDIEVLRSFFQHIAAYPIGTFVGLSNGFIGIVTYNKAGFPLRPLVRVLCNKEEFEPLKPFELNLIEKINVVVEKVYRADELPESISQGTGVFS